MSVPASDPPAPKRPGLRAAALVRGNPSARLLGSAQQTSTDLAAFANTALVCYLDCNDTWLAR